MTTSPAPAGITHILATQKRRVPFGHSVCHAQGWMTEAGPVVVVSWTGDRPPTPYAEAQARRELVGDLLCELAMAAFWSSPRP